MSAAAKRLILGDKESSVYALIRAKMEEFGMWFNKTAGTFATNELFSIFDDAKSVKENGWFRKGKKKHFIYVDLN